MPGCAFLDACGVADALVARPTASMRWQEPWQPLVMSVAIGYRLPVFQTFVLTLRRHYTGEATLIVDGRDIMLEDVELSGTSSLVIKACEGAKVTVQGAFNNDGFELVELSDADRTDDSVPEYLKIRGYRFENRGAAVYEFAKPGDYTVEA